MKVNIEYLNPACKINYETDAAAACDVKASIHQTIELWAGDKVLIPLGFKLDMPDNMCAILIPRSGLGSKLHIHLANVVGLIDPDYKKEVKAYIINNQPLDSQQPFYIEPNMRIGQLIFMPFYRVKFNETSIEDNGRGGFGHTGT